jgi:hypothetical protein
MNAKLPVIALTILAAIACDKGDTTACDTADTASNCTSETGDTNVAVLSPTYNWDNDGLTVSVDNNPGTGFDLGIAETGSPDGWYGEDCFNGTAGYNYCHGFNSNSASLSALGDGAAPGSPDDVVAGSTTLLNKDLAFNGDGSDRLTYMLTVDGGTCITWGDDTGYYSSFGCTEYN